MSGSYTLVEIYNRRAIDVTAWDISLLIALLIMSQTVFFLNLYRLKIAYNQIWQISLTLITLSYRVYIYNLVF